VIFPRISRLRLGLGLGFNLNKGPIREVTKHYLKRTLTLILVLPNTNTNTGAKTENETDFHYDTTLESIFIKRSNDRNIFSAVGKKGKGQGHDRLEESFDM
jgi:hypothetical protein